MEDATASTGKIETLSWTDSQRRRGPFVSFSSRSPRGYIHAELARDIGVGEYNRVQFAKDASGNIFMRLRRDDKRGVKLFPQPNGPGCSFSSPNIQDKMGIPGDSRWEVKRIMTENSRYLVLELVEVDA